MSNNKVGRPKKYAGELLKKIIDDLEIYIESTEIPILAEFAYQQKIPRQYLYEIPELKPLIEKIMSINNKSNVKKYNYDKYINSNQVTKYKYKNDPTFKLKVCFSRNLRRCLKMKNVKKTSKTTDILVNKLGYNLNDLKRHLERLFQDDMNWDNYGKWHVDHIKPISKFNYKSIDDVEFKKCWGLSNLQPLWAGDNIRKGNAWYE